MPSELKVTGYEPPERFEFTATGGPVGTPEGDPHRHEFLLTPEDGGTRLEVQRWDPVPLSQMGVCGSGDCPCSVLQEASLAAQAGDATL